MLVLQLRRIQGVRQHTVAEPLEEEIEASSGLVAQAQTWSTIRAIRPVVDVVLEETLGAVVCEALGQLDDGDQVCGGRQVLANAAEGAPLMLGWLLSVGGWLVISWLCSVGGGGFLVGDSIGSGDVATSS